MGKTVFIVWHGALFASYRKPFQRLQEKYGWDVHLLAPTVWRKCLPRKTRYEVDARETLTSHIHRPFFSFHGAFYFQPTFPFLFNRIKPDVLLVVEEPFSVMGWLASYWCQRHVPPVPMILYSYQNIHKKYPPPFRWFEAYVLQNTGQILVSDSHVGEVLVQKGYRNPWDVLALGVNLDRFTYKSPLVESNLFTVGYVGRLADEKGLDTLLWALEELDDSIRLHLVGDGPARFRLEKMAKELGVYERVAFRPPVPHEELAEVYHQFDALVLPSKTTSRWKEQFGRVLIEAMACGTPVIGSDSGAIPEVVGDAGLLFPENNPKLLADRISLLYHDTHLRRTLSLRGRVRVEHHYSAERVAQKLHQHLSRVVERAYCD
jgi:glycosyltransferase involved in cell wall biosynthesis